MAQNVSLVSGHEHPGICGRRRPADENADAVLAVVHGGLRTLAVDQDRNDDPARAAELKAVACGPRGIGLRRAFRSGFLGILAIKQVHNTKRGGSAVGFVRHGAERGEIAIDEAGIDLCLAEAFGTAERAEEGDVRPHAGDERVIESIGEPMQRNLACRRIRDQLGDHGIVEGRHLAALFHPALDPHVGRKFQSDDRTGRGQEAVIRIFSIDPRFNGVASEGDFALRQRQLFAGRDLKLPGDEIEPGDLFRHRMLDLKPRIHLDEPEAVRAQSACCHRRRIRPCPRRHSRPPSRPRPRLRPSRRAGSRVIPGAGASSITFWWRRCNEQSRSPR